MTAAGQARPWQVLADELDAVFGYLEGLADAFAAAVTAAGHSYSRADLAQLRPAIFDGLDRFRDLAVGSGIVPAEALLADTPHWMEWWWRRAGGEPELLRVNLDANAPDFFDFPNDEWFTSPAAGNGRNVAGPYVDYACTNEYTFTISVAARHNQRSLGVIGMDVPCAHVERRAMPALAALPAATALVNREGRVIAANHAALPPGHRVDRHTTAAPASAAAGKAASFEPVATLTGWSLVHIELPAR